MRYHVTIGLTVEVTPEEVKDFKRRHPQANIDAKHLAVTKATSDFIEDIASQAQGNVPKMRATFEVEELQ